MKPLLELLGAGSQGVQMMRLFELKMSGKIVNPTGIIFLTREGGYSRAVDI